MPGHWVGRTRSNELPPEWPTIRDRILTRDGRACQWTKENGRLCLAPAQQVDHVVRGNDHSDTNLRAICNPHHAQKTSAEGNAERWRHREQRPRERHSGLA